MGSARGGGSPGQALPPEPRRPRRLPYRNICAPVKAERDVAEVRHRNTPEVAPRGASVTTSAVCNTASVHDVGIDLI